MVFVCLAADCVNEIDAKKVYGYALYKDGKDTRLSYPLEKFHKDVAGRSFHHGRFIQRLREKAASLPKYSSFDLTYSFLQESTQLPNSKDCLLP